MAYPETWPTQGQNPYYATLTTGLENVDSRLNDAEVTITGLGDSATRDVGTTVGTVAAGDDARFDYGVHVVTWNGTNYRYRGANITARPANLADYVDGGIMDVDTTQDATHTSPPALTGGQAGDRWTPHESIPAV